jgi:hypothetical protein
MPAWVIVPVPGLVERRWCTELGVVIVRPGPVPRKPRGDIGWVLHSPQSGAW